jgi:hypothetical protein
MVVDEDVKHGDPTVPSRNVGFTPGPRRGEEKAAEADEVSVLQDIRVFLLALVLVGFFVVCVKFLIMIQ